MSKIPDKLVTFVIGSACSGKSTLAGYMGRKGHGLTFRASKHLEEYVSNMRGHYQEEDNLLQKMNKEISDFTKKERSKIEPEINKQRELVKKYLPFKDKTLQSFIGTDFLCHIPDVDDACLLCDGIEQMIFENDKVIIDGYPRSLYQMFTFKKYLNSFASKGHLLRVVNLVVPIEELLRRMNIRSRIGDTEQRVLSEISIHQQISRMFKEIAETHNKLSFIEFNIPADADNMKVQRDFTAGMTGKMQEISFIDSIGRRLNEIFLEIEWKRNDGISKKAHRSINL